MNRRKMFTRALYRLSFPTIFAACLASPGVHAAEAAPPVATPLKEATVMRLRGGAILRKSPGAEFTIEKPRRLQLGPPNTEKILVQTLTLTSGRVDIELPIREEPVTAVLVRTPRDVSAIAKGGRSTIIVSEGNTTVAAASGEMLAGIKERWKKLGSGQVRAFRPSGGALDHPIMTAPTLAVSTPLVLKLSDGPSSPVQVRAAPLPNAKSYEFALWKVEGGKPQLVKRLSSSAETLQLPELEPGNYAVSARGIEASGVESPESELTALRVVRASLPSGAALWNGAIVMKPYQRVQLQGIEDVEISYDKLDWFRPAPTSVGLYQGRPTLVRLRAKGTSRESVVLLEPLTIQAEIQIGPRRAAWPADAVHVNVRLSDARGRPLPSDTQVKPFVTVNGAPLNLDWKRESAGLVALVPPSVQKGPWIVRVELLDDTGHAIARDFLEVAAEDPKVAVAAERRR